MHLHACTSKLHASISGDGLMLINIMQPFSLHLTHFETVYLKMPAYLEPIVFVVLAILIVYC